MEKNKQAKFWSGSFGNSYIKRNQSKKIINSNYFLFKKIFKNISFSSVIEFGSNIGNNIIVLNKLIKEPKKICAIEINSKACKVLRKKFSNIEIINSNISEYKIKKKYDLVLSKGFLIHINPKELGLIYKKIYESCKKYILICEYYSSKPKKEVYRNYKDKLFKRDFAGELLKKYKDLKLLDYGFSYHLDKFPQDDLNWFLIKKN